LKDEIKFYNSQGREASRVRSEKSFSSGRFILMGSEARLEA